MLLSPVRMHIPDGLLSVSISLLTWGITTLVLSLVLKRVGKDLSERQIPWMGVMAAFIFAAQMINFPVAGGTSGHLLGGMLAGVTLGPWAGMLAMASVIIVQGLLFQDGGLLVMGANILNMGILTVLAGYGLYRAAAGQRWEVRLAVIGVAAWLSVMAGALATSLELWLSQTARLEIVTPAMLSIHALIGLGEALITVAAVAFILKSRPDILESGASASQGGRGWALAGLGASLAVVLLAPLASADPDGLERVATNLGFIDRGVAGSSPVGLLPDYVVPLLGPTPLSTILAGAAGVLAVGAAAALLARVLIRSRRSQSASQR